MLVELLCLNSFGGICDQVSEKTKATDPVRSGPWP